MHVVDKAFQDHRIFNFNSSNEDNNEALVELNKLVDNEVNSVSIMIPSEVNPLSVLADVFDNRNLTVGALLINNDFPEDKVEVTEELSILDNLLNGKSMGILVIMNSHDLFIYPQACNIIQDYLEKGLRTVFVHAEQTMH